MKRSLLFTVVLAAILTIEAVFAAHMLSSSAIMHTDSTSSVRVISKSEFDSSANNVVSSILSDIFEIPKVYVLPLAEEPMPEPDSDGYSVVTDSDLNVWNDTEVQRYKDETTCVTLWKEYVESENCHAVISFAEIQISHPSQLRHHMAGWEYGEAGQKATALAQEVNAVVAVSGDFYNFRRGGIKIQNRQLYRNAPSDSMPDILFVDINGDFHIETCSSSFDTEAYLSGNDIMFSMTFGPGLVRDGVPISKEETAAYKGEGGVAYLNPRTAIGQVGPLHYLFCTVDGRNKDSNGIDISELAAILAEKGCVNAYNLDGGGSATMVFRDKVYNATPSGNQRYIADIVFIATAVPDSE